MAAGPSTVKRHAHELAVDRDGKRHITEPPSGSASPAPEAPERMYCVCRQSYDDERVMIACDYCDEWYHASCIQISEDSLALIDTFVCPRCETTVPHRTSYKVPCHHVGCNEPARLPMSRYCSDRCGIAEVLERIEQLPYARTAAERARLAPKTTASEPTRGLVLWAQPDLATPSPDVDGADSAWFAHIRAHVTRGAQLAPALEPGTSLRAYVREHATRLDLSSYDLARWTRELARLDEQSAVLHARVDLLAARSKLLQAAEDRQSTLPAVDDNGASCPPCGFDERLCWDDEALLAWLGTPEGQACIGESRTVPSPGPATATLCLVAKRRCKRHADWSAVRGAELDLLRDAQTQHLSALSERAQQVRLAMQHA
ncbi:Similar to S.cerevisiae protein SPP1 (Subunit of COMPASS (Set1C)) [Malassezia sympodialis ATCC 42132]|uniref:CXXC-type zinc finger protein 1 n=1 Tax=Malassezia sympodialis (strain ATCC 42132) TaxID=1230383 RepID=A0A1M8A5X4_MALS4|nr:Similar to S.cerevisiae protein SPP1 (Subunit of COMPASS (Set1C)) [Malassezia sympodialis ATCC 42132]